MFQPCHAKIQTKSHQFQQIVRCLAIKLRYSSGVFSEYRFIVGVVAKGGFFSGRTGCGPRYHSHQVIHREGLMCGFARFLHLPRLEFTRIENRRSCRDISAIRTPIQLSAVPPQFILLRPRISTTSDRARFQ